ncbi:MAG: glutathione S-transferase family protein [Myxococcota bacterium]|nr:glutathione S-transferase family protein [Myxococcota bacterium]
MELVGRSSSSFTRVARIFALELGVEHAFRPVFDLTSANAAAYAGNPALKIPILVDEQGPLFGTENICRVLARGANPVVLRGDISDRLVANMEELALHGLTTSVAIVMGKATGGGASTKSRESLEQTIGYLDTHVDALLAALPERRISFVETALFCLVRHLPWREVMNLDAFARLASFADTFGARGSARQTEYHFDQH